MNEWKIQLLENLCSKITVGHVGSMTSQYTDAGIPFLRSLNIKRGKIDLTSIKHVSPTFHEKLKKTQLQPGDIVIVRTGEPGAAAVIPSHLPSANCSDIIIARAKPEIDTRFLCYAINETAKDFIRAHTVGAVQQHFNVSSAKSLPINTPPLKEQQAIAAALGALDDKIAVNEHTLTVYEEILQAKFDHIINTDQQENTPNTPATKLVEFNPKTEKPTEEEAVYVDMAALPTDRAPISSWTHRKPKSGSRFLNGDTLLARITPCLENGKTGYVDFMNDGQIGMGSTEFIVMRSHTNTPREFSYFLARNKRFRNHAIQKMAGTSGRQRVSAADASNFFIRQPTEEELRDFGAETSKAFAHMKSLTAESRILAELRDTLLPQLMSGKLRVKDAEKLVEDAT
ncbi:restriction endonuclease subunit S [Nocardiopsis halotolerans]|uniref:restriction endonuclease subunit S n=1 Tax=Nocardiopsis halotolerans TaxID=124252 RepID=UPI0009FD69B3|nr:restriction endonuclease subunit S [Nocardiopsis halotolerans]